MWWKGIKVGYLHDVPRVSHLAWGLILAGPGFLQLLLIPFLAVARKTPGRGLVRAIVTMVNLLSCAHIE